MSQRLSKILAAAGVASRRAAEEIIGEGRVTVNGEMTLVPQTMVDIENDQIMVDGVRIHAHEPKRYFILNKPKGYVCSAKPGSELRSVLDLFSHIRERLFTVGRLDVETTGLILVTNDGHFANRVIHPRSNVHKEYLVKVTSEITLAHLKQLSKGGFVEGAYVRPVRVTKVRRNTAKMVVREGRKREVRRLFEQAELKVVQLERIRIGNLRLGSLPIGEAREVSLEECEKLFD